MKQGKHMASISLGVMGLGYVASMPFHGNALGNLILGGFEAGLVGGLADWFAVTALFRHPLGIPIPHTALLPNNRDRVIQSLISAIENDILTKESIKGKVGELKLGEQGLRWAEEHVPEVAGGLVTLAGYLLDHVSFDKAAPLIERQVKDRIRGLDLPSILDKLAQETVSREWDQKAFLYLAERLEAVVSRDQFREQAGRMAMGAIGNIKMGGLMQFAVNAFLGYMSEERLGDILQTELLKALTEMKYVPDHPWRVLILTEVRGELLSLGRNPSVLQSLESWREQTLEEWKLEEQLSGWLSQLQERAKTFIREDRFRDDYAIPLINRALTRLHTDRTMVESLQGWVEGQLYRMVEHNHAKIGKLVQENLEKLDNDTLIEMLEDKVGKDLQWIRVNGAVCGFLIGLILQGIRLAVG